MRSMLFVQVEGEGHAHLGAWPYLKALLEGGQGEHVPGGSEG